MGSHTYLSDADYERLRDYERIYGGCWRKINGAYVSDNAIFRGECTIVGGMIQSGEFRDSIIAGGVIIGGLFDNTKIVNCEVYAGEFSDSFICDGLFFGGNFNCVTIAGGEYHGGAWNGSPIQVITKSGYVVSESDNGHITIGCTRLTIDDWKRYAKTLCDKYGISDNHFGELSDAFEYVARRMIHTNR